MIFVQHKFESDFLQAIKSQDYKYAMDMLTCELADWIVSNPTTFADALAESGVKIKDTSVKTVAEAFLNNIHKNEELKSLIVGHYVKGTKNSRLFSKQLKGAINLMCDSHIVSAADRKGNDVDYMELLKKRIIDYGKRRTIAADGDATNNPIPMEETKTATPAPPPPAPAKKGFYITTDTVFKGLVYALAAYGAYNLFILIKNNYGRRPNNATAGNGAIVQPVVPAAAPQPAAPSTVGQPVGIGQQGLPVYQL